MAFDKIARTTLTQDGLVIGDNIQIIALNNPEGQSWNIYSESFKQPLIKTASKTASLIKDKKIDLNGFNLQAAIKQYPDRLFVKVFAIKQDQVNDNGDYFSAQELKKSASTFIGCPVFVNHQNTDIEKARGSVVHAWYDKQAKGIFTINSVDCVAYPKLARGIENGYVTGSSMGCQVQVSCCSICAQAATVPSEYCEHIANRKNKKFTGKVKIAYGKNGVLVNDSKKCPIDLKTDEQGYVVHEAQRIFEHNFNVKFIQDSFVVNPACHSCLVQQVLNTTNLSKKFASLMDGFERIKNANSTCYDGTCRKDDKLEKIAGVTQLQKLATAMNQIQAVTRSMMSQKQQISMQYVSDLVKTLADLQKYTDQLTDMGYGQLPSPDITSSSLSNNQSTSQANTPIIKPNAAINAAPPPMQGNNNFQSTPLQNGELGTVTKPKFAENNLEQIKESSLNIRSKDSDTINYQQKQESNSMDKNASENSGLEKVAYGTENKQPSKTTQGQLQDAKGKSKDYAGNRTQEVIDMIPEKRMEKKVDVNNTTSESPINRTEKSYEVITQKQLDSVKSGYIVRLGQFPEVITEKQFTEAHRAIASVLSEKQDNLITEKQLANFNSHHKYSQPEVITEKQFQRKASNNSQNLVKTAMESISDTIAYFGKTPSEIAKAASVLASEKSILKTAFVTLLNAAPYKKESLINERERVSYFGKKIASVNNLDAKDALVMSMAYNLGNLSASDLTKAVELVSLNKSAMKKVQASAELKMNTTPNTEKEQTIDKFAEVKNILASFDAPEDGIYQVNIPLEDINEKLEDKIAFINATKKIASIQIKQQEGVDVDVQVINIDINKVANNNQEKQIVVATVKEVSKLTPEEKTACSNIQKALVKTSSTLEQNMQKRASNRQKLVKTAQMFGGQMGDQGGASQAPGAGAGAATPGAGAPQAGAAPIQSFDASSAPQSMPVDQSESNDPTPPGTTCPACGSHDVDMTDGDMKCNSCGFKGTVHVQIISKNWPGTVSSQGKNKQSKDELSGTGVALPNEGENASAPMGLQSSASVDNEQVIKVAKVAITGKITPQIAKNSKKFASVSPLTGSENTLKIAENTYLCMDTGNQYEVKLASSTNGKQVYAQWSWNPTTPELNCKSCKENKFASVLNSVSIKQQEFDAMSLKQKAQIIIKASKSGAFNIKTASKKQSILTQIKVASSDWKFPSEQCITKISSMFGQNAIALSGPCEGQNLAQSICKRMKSANAYSQSIITKVASIWSQKDACEECSQDMVRDGFTLKQAGTICAGLKMKYAQFADQVADELSSIEQPVEDNPTDPDNNPDGGLPVESQPSFDDIDNGTDNAKLIADLIKNLGLTQKVDAKLDQALGQTKQEMAAQGHHPQIEAELSKDNNLNPEETLLGHEKTVEEEQKNGQLSKIGDQEDSSKNMQSNEISDKITQEKDMGSCCSDDYKNNSEINKGVSENKQKEDKQKEMDSRFAEAQSMKQSKISKVNHIGLNLTGVIQALNKKAGKLSFENAQDNKDLNISSGSATIGHEQKFNAKSPEIPTGKALIGNEKQIKESNLDIFTGKAQIGNEELKSEKTDKSTGSEDGQGKIASSKDRMRIFAQTIIKKQAEKLQKKNIQNDKDLNLPKGNATIGHEQKFDAKSPEIPTGKALIGNQVQIKTQKLDIATGKAQIGNEELKSEKTNQITGKENTPVTARSGQQIKAGREQASKVAGKLLIAGIISAEEISSKIDQLSSYDTSALDTIEKLACQQTKGLKTGNGGMQTPIMVQASVKEVPNMKKTLQSMFSGTKQADAAQATLADFRKDFGR